MHVFSVERLKEVPSAVGSTRLLGEATPCLAAETIHGLLFPSLVFLNCYSDLENPVSFFFVFVYNDTVEDLEHVL